MRVVKNLVEKGLEEGAFGLSTGLSYAHAKMTPYLEIKTLTEAVAKYKGVYATHLRNERSKIAQSVEETVKVAKENGLKAEISHLRPILGFEREFEEALKLIDESLTDADVTFDAYPFDSSVVPVYTLLPSWARHGNLEKMVELLKTAANRERIIGGYAEADRRRNNDCRRAEKRIFDRKNAERIFPKIRGCRRLKALSG